MTMHRITAVSTLAILVAAAFITANPAHAGEQHGVKCPDGYNAQISNGDRKLVCGKTAQYTVKPICTPLVFSAKGVNVSGNVTLDTRNEDKCLATVSGQTIEPQFTGMPVGTTNYTIRRTRTDPIGQDTYVATVTDYAFPQGGPVYVGDASRGVQCPAGYDGTERFSGRGIRCYKNDGAPKRADCDGVHAGIVSVGWKLELDKRGREDRCVPSHSGDPGPTKPEGMTKVQHDADSARDDVSWVLNEREGRDQWQRRVYAWPKSDFPL
jgi:hypothetical protein